VRTTGPARKAAIENGGNLAPFAAAQLPADQIVQDHRFLQAHRQPGRIKGPYQQRRTAEGAVHDKAQRCRRAGLGQRCGPGDDRGLGLAQTLVGQEGPGAMRGARRVPEEDGIMLRIVTMREQDGI